MMNLMDGEHNMQSKVSHGKSMKANSKMEWEMGEEKCTSPMAPSMKESLGVEKYRGEGEKYVLMGRLKKRTGKQWVQLSSFLIINDGLY